MCLNQTGQYRTDRTDRTAGQTGQTGQQDNGTINNNFKHIIMNNSEIKQELQKYLLDPSKDYRKRLSGFKVNNHGDLLIKRNKWEVLILKEHLANENWLSIMTKERGMNYGQFVRAYFLACEKAGIQQMVIKISGFKDSYLYEGETNWDRRDTRAIGQRYILHPSKDYKMRLLGFKVNKRGDLLFKENRWEILIPKGRLDEDDWLSDMTEERGMNYGQFVCAYLLACEKAGIKQMQIRIFCFEDSYLFEDE
ncbi:MAG: hypothetical protein II670_02860 [Alphaproteobacteria bacterium]|nr:hypothetical protein [Alphaproteobacteria bacterium]